MSPTNLIFEALKTVRSFAPLLWDANANVHGIKPNCILVGSRADQPKASPLATPNEFPQLKLMVRGDTHDQNTPRVFGMNDPTFKPSTHCDSVVPVTSRFLMTLVHRNTAWDQQAPVEEAVDRFLDSLRPNMGLENLRVTSIVVNNTRTDETSPTTGGEQRTVSRRLITVQSRPYHSALI